MSDALQDTFKKIPAVGFNDFSFALIERVEQFRNFCPESGQKDINTLLVGMAGHLFYLFRGDPSVYSQLLQTEIPALGAGRRGIPEGPVYVEDKGVK